MLPNLPSELFSGPQLIAFEAKRSAVVRRARSAPLIVGKTVLAGLVLAFVCVIEYSAFKDVYDFLKEPLPGEEPVWSTAILALTGAIMVIALHLRAAANPDALPVRVLERAVDVLLPLYMIGAGLMVSGVLFFDGADGLFRSASNGFESFASAAASRSPPVVAVLFEEFLAPAFSIVFVLGAGAVVVISVYVGHRCLVLINQHLTDLFGRVSDAREAVAAYAEILECQHDYRKAADELVGLARLGGPDMEAELTAEVASVISEAIRGPRLWVNEQQISPQASPYEAKRTLNVEEVEKRVRAIESITPQEIIAALRGTFAKKETRDEDATVGSSGDDDGNGGGRNTHTWH